jgi:hypothetical protein
VAACGAESDARLLIRWLVAEVSRLRRVFEQLPKKTSPGCTSAREFRVILLCSTVLFGAQMAATPSRRADLLLKHVSTIRYLPPSGESPILRACTHNAGVEGSSPSLSTNQISVLEIGPPNADSP